MFRRGKLAFLNTKDDRIKIINERINLTEKHLVEMCTTFAACTRKMAKFRDSYDELSKSLKHYADDEEINESFSEGLKNLTNAVTILADYMDLNVHRMEIKIVNELSQFDNLCKTTRDNLRTAVIARDKEVLKQRQMLELKSKFSANNSATDSELVKAKMEVNRTNKEIDEIISNFEKRKLNDMKIILSDFILISMKYHTKVLEALSASYYDVSNIDERGDFLEFQKLMKSKNETIDKKSSKKKRNLRSQSMESLERDQLISPLKRKGRISKSNKNLTESKTDDDDDDDEEEEEDEDEADDDEDGEDDSDNSKTDDESNTEAEDVGEANAASDSASETKANNTQFKFKKPLAKPQVKHPFKAVAATHVLKKSSKSGKSAFVTKRLTTGGASGISASSMGTGIPRLVAKREDNSKHLSSSSSLMVDSGEGNSTRRIRGGGVGGSDNRRLVTIVDSKKKSKMDKDMANVIDCTRKDGN